jgi:hypothetical protein
VCFNISGGIFIQNLNFSVFRDCCFWFFCMPEKAISAIRKEGAAKQNIQHFIADGWLCVSTVSWSTRRECSQKAQLAE